MGRRAPIDEPVAASPRAAMAGFDVPTAGDVVVTLSPEEAEVATPEGAAGSSAFS